MTAPKNTVPVGDLSHLLDQRESLNASKENGSAREPSEIKPLPDSASVNQQNLRDPTHDYYLAPPTLFLPADGANPFYSKRIQKKAGDALDVILKDFVGKHLVDGDGKGAQVAMTLGSFPGNLHPELPIHRWDIDKKIDMVVWGDAEAMIRNLAESHRWNRPVQSSWWDRINLKWIKAESPFWFFRFIHRDRPDPAKHATYTDYLTEYAHTKGIVYLPIQVETPQGPVAAKVGLLDRGLWEAGFKTGFSKNFIPRGELMASQRASLLPITHGAGGTFHFINEQVEENFLDQVRQVHADYARHALDSFAGQRSFTGEELIARRYEIQFSKYDALRSLVFREGRKGPQQLARYEESYPNLPSEILAPAVADVLKGDHSYDVFDSEGNEISPDQITPEIFKKLTFVDVRSEPKRQLVLDELGEEFREINRRLWPKSWWNVSSGKFARKSPHRPSWLGYFLRKIRVISNGSHGVPVRYAMDASHFVGNPEDIRKARLGYTGVPLNRNIIVAGYPPAKPSDLADGVNYATAEIRKGKKINPLLKGNSPSKFSFPLSGDVPVVAHRLMEGMRSPAIDEIPVSGTEDVRIIGEAFRNHFQAELKARNTSIHIYQDAGSLPGNIKNGIDHPGRKGKMSVLSFGDVPFSDIHNIAYNPWRHHIDYVFGTNGRDVLLDFMGMNAHYAAELEGVTYAFKEGNTQGVRNFNKIEMAFWSSIYNNRKSVTGKMMKVGIILAYFLRNPISWTSLPGLIFHALPRMARNVLYNKAGRSKHPTVIFSALPLFEYAFAQSLGVEAEFRPNHIDPRATLDVDGLRDYMLVRLMSELHPSPHQADLEKFVRETLLKPEYRDKLPALDGIHKIINRSFIDFYHGILAKQKQGKTWERKSPKAKELAESELIRTLHENGFNPEVLPFLENGEMNRAWIQVGLPGDTLEWAKKAADAYDRRTKYAEGLLAEFMHWNEEEKVPSIDHSVSEPTEKFAQRQIDSNPEYYRGLILESNFGRIQNEMVKAAEAKFGKKSFQVSELSRYFDLSLRQKVKTPLRKILGGLKAVDVLRRYVDFVSPAEYQALYPRLVEQMEQARAVVPGNKWLRSFPKGPFFDGAFLLRGFLDVARRTADAAYVRKVGESPPSNRKGLLSRFLHHSHSRRPVLGEIPLPDVEKDFQGEIKRVDTAVWHPEDVELFTRRAKVLPSRIPHLMAAASGARHRGDLKKVSEQRMTMERLLAWTNTEEGLKFFAQDPYRVRDNLKNRLREGAVPLGVGLATLWGGEWLADKIGIDPLNRPHERFMAVVGASHVMGQVAGAGQEVLLNRVSLQTPFDFVTSRAVRMGAEHGIQFSLESRSGSLGAAAASLGRNFSFSGGPLKMGWQAMTGMGKFFLRTPWEMGAGLMSAALVDKFIAEDLFHLKEDSGLRRGIHLGSFFAPQLAELAMGRKLPPAFSGPMLTWGSRAFALGFIADMAYLGINRLQNGSAGAVQNNLIYHQANQIHDADNNQSFLARCLDGAFEMVAPNLAAWWDSVELKGGSFQANSYQLRAKEELVKFSKEVRSESRAFLAKQLLHGRGGEKLNPDFYARVDISFLRGKNSLKGQRGGRKLPTDKLWQDLTRSPEFARRFNAISKNQDKIRFIQRQYSGWSLSTQDVRTMLRQIQNYRTRKELGELAELPLQEDKDLQPIFTKNGALKTGKESALLRWVFSDSTVTETSLVQARRAGLARRILELREAGGPTKELESLTRVARKIGLLSEEGHWLQKDILEQSGVTLRQAG